MQACDTRAPGSSCLAGCYYRMKAGAVHLGDNLCFKVEQLGGSPLPDGHSSICQALLGASLSVLRSLLASPGNAVCQLGSRDGSLYANALP